MSKRKIEKTQLGGLEDQLLFSISDWALKSVLLFCLVLPNWGNLAGCMHPLVQMRLRFDPITNPRYKTWISRFLFNTQRDLLTLSNDGSSNTTTLRFPKVLCTAKIFCRWKFDRISSNFKIFNFEFPSLSRNKMAIPLQLSKGRQLLGTNRELPSRL